MIIFSRYDAQMPLSMKNNDVSKSNCTFSYGTQPGDLNLLNIPKSMPGTERPWNENYVIMWLDTKANSMCPFFKMPPVDQYFEN